MMRKLIMTAAVAAMPVGMLAVGSGSAFAAGKVPATAPDATTCTVAGGVTFAKPGMTTAGRGSKTNFSKWELGATTTGTDCGPGVKIKVVTYGNATDACTGTNAPVIGCVPNGYYYNKASNFGGSNLTALQSALEQKGVAFTDGGNNYVLVASKSSVIFGAQCGSSVGYSVSGTVLGFGSTTWSMTLCYGTDTGTGGTTGQFWPDWYAEASGTTAGKAMVIATAAFNSTDSKLVIS